MKKDSFPFHDSALKGFRALICGASKGIGRSIAESMAKTGADVIICSRNKDALVEFCDELKINISDLTSKSDVNMINTISELLDDQLFEDLDIYSY